MKKIDFLTKNLIAHRGFYTKNIPENSIVAFIKAMEYNLIIELDIHFLKDDNIVVFHDYNLKRLTGKNDIIESLTIDKLNKYKIYNRYTIPTLETVLKVVNGRVPILIEIKELGFNSNFLVKLADILDNYDGLFALQSSNPRVIDWFYKAKKKYVIGLIIFNDLNYKLFKKNMKKTDFLTINKKSLPFKTKKIVLGWTINSKKEIEKYSSLCDNLICNIGGIYD